VFQYKRKKKLQITDDRLHHILAVATKMRELAETEHNIYPVDPDEAFTLGMLHDIGYQFVDEQKQHAHAGGEVLEKQGYKYSKEIYYHGVKQDEYDSSMLQLLNYADMTTGPAGQSLTLQERINDIADRYGKDSQQVADAVELADFLVAQREM
jgi:predicted hydrolase (HD superfamily)